MNMDDLKRLHDAARANGVKSREFQQFQIKMYEQFPAIYDIARKLTDSNNEMQQKMDTLDDIVLQRNELQAAAEKLLPFLSTQGEMLDAAALNDGRASEFDMACVAMRESLAKVGAPA